MLTEHKKLILIVQRIAPLCRSKKAKLRLIQYKSLTTKAEDKATKSETTAESNSEKAILFQSSSMRYSISCNVGALKGLN